MFVDLSSFFTDSRVDSFPLISSPLPLLGIIAVYFYFVYSLGPRLMKGRPPLKLNSIIVIYNVVQVVANAVNASIVSVCCPLVRPL